MTTNYSLREMLSRIPVVQCREVVSHLSLLKSRFLDLPKETKIRAADAIAHGIAGQVMRGGTWQHTTLPDGEEFRLYGYWLTYNQMYELLKDAYSLGKTEQTPAPKEQL